MGNTRRNAILLSAALSAVSMWGVAPAAAQYQAGQDGHANDASNRVGSGGYNTGHPINNAVTGNDIVNRNVTGGFSFRGPVNEGDPLAFRARLPGMGVDRFVAGSAGVPTANGAPSDLNQPHPYYGSSRFVAPPSGSLPVGFTGGYTGTTVQTPSSLSNSLNTAPAAESLQSRIADRDTLLLNASINPAGYPGLVDYGQSNTLTASPLFGVRSVAPGELNFLSAGGVLPDQLGGAQSDQSLLQMRRELQDAAMGITPGSREGNNPSQLTSPNQPINPGQPNNNTQNGNGNRVGNDERGTNPGENPGASTSSGPRPLNQPMAQPFDSPAEAQLHPRVNGQVLNQPLGASVQNSSRPGLVPAVQQSPLLQSLQERLKNYETANGLADTTSNAGATRKPPVKTVKVPVPGAPGTPNEGPVKVSSLATGIKAQGLHDLLAGAEELMRQGKFDSAIDRYATAQRVASNNPLIPLGRAHAELAAGYYAQADKDLRAVFNTDPELLLAQFDLPGVIPAERLQYLRKDLQSLAQSEPQSERPWFLLAYVNYNSNDPQAAEKDLAEAEKRASRADWSIRLLRKHWAIPSGKTPATPQSAAPQPGPQVSQPAEAPAPDKTPAPDLNK